MFSILHAEWFKLRKTKIIPLIFVGPLVGLVIGFSYNFHDRIVEVVGDQWILLSITMNLVYALLFLPLITGVLASSICRYEHQTGGWKQLLTLPVTRGKLFIAKYILLMLLVLAMQLLLLATLYIIGAIKGFTTPFPLEVFWKSILGGWVATFPLVALQLWMSILFKSFAAPLTVNVIFTLPSVLIINSERYGPYYPWAQPFSMMYIGEHTNNIFFIPWEQVVFIVGGSFVLFFAGGYLYFQRKSV
ncbi:ABC transporter permease [Terribacillus sp. DMT04]|uniref:ABC transporter permease n=1 Tax=Terribacillus sp. DMT04 TaxID=2850441 RepID=UPI001C2C3608|nr:ABC transporter permease [Terribacillus sp. DMT04]QXE01004.1 ABC transporter permease [Terribacillus sp. DMT04]